MKNLFKCLVIMMMLAMAILVVSETDTYAATKKAKKKVTYTLKKGTLTIKGKGKMPKSMTFKNNKKIKKVVIKKGVTSISNYAFYKCKNLKSVKIANTVKQIGWHSFQNTKIKKLSIPKSVKIIGNQSFHNCYELTTVTMPGNFKLKVKDGDMERYPIMNYDSVKTINFNTNFNIKIAPYLRGKRWNVRKKDPKYKSIDGVIYSKDGKDIVRVPSDRVVLKIAEGCETFCLQSIFYGKTVRLKGEYACCSSLEKITIPKSVKYIEDERYPAKYKSMYIMSLEKLVVNTKQLDTESIITLATNLREIMYDKVIGYDVRNVKQLFPDRITVKDGFYILDGSVLLDYDGKEEVVTVPNGIKIIADKAFGKTIPYEEAYEDHYMTTGEEDYKSNIWNIKKVILPEGTEEIRTAAFYNSSLEDIYLPSSLKTIGQEAFAHTSLKSIKLSEGLKHIGARAFMYTYLKEINLPKSLDTIGEDAFIGTMVK